MEQLSSFDSLLEYLTLNSIMNEYKSHEMDILYKNKAIKWVDYPTMALIINPDGDDIRIYSNEPDYDDKIRTYQQQGYQIAYDDSASGYNIVKENPDISEEINRYKYQLLPAKLEDMTNSIISDLKSILFKGNYDNLIQFLKGSIQSKLQQEAKLFKQFPACEKAIKDIESYLKNTWGINLELSYTLSHNINKTVIKADIKPTNLLKLKTNVSPKVFREIYNKFVDNDIVDSEEVEEDSFVSALAKSDTNSKITFLCSTPLAVNLIEEIKVLFIRFNATIVQNSNIFYTKDGYQLMSINYNKAKKKIDEADTITLNKLKKELKPIISSAIK